MHASIAGRAGGVHRDLIERLLDDLAVRPTFGWLRDPWLYALLLAALPVAFVLRMLIDTPPSASVRSIGWLAGFIVWQPLVEELLFRGALQGKLRGTGPGRWQRAGMTGANLLASVLFALAHAVYHPPLWAAAVFVPSLVYGYMRDRHGSIFPGLLLHCAFNAAYVLAALP
jgi:membrane protease YdiL (CAAX protease family)